MKNLLSRIATVLVLLPVVLWALFTGGNPLNAMLFCVACFSIFEITTIVWPQNKKNKLLTMALLIGFTPIIFGAGLIVCFLAIFVSLFLLQMVILFSHSIQKEHFEKIGAIFFFSLYLVIALASVNWTYSLVQNGTSFVFIACACTWLNDTFAYFIGKNFGRKPLFLSVSEKKTWEGFIGGGVLSLVFVLLIVYLNNLLTKPLLNLNYKETLFLCAPTVFLGPVGDLIESRLKRFYKVKDSSSILPGHGGILDRIDGLLTVLPWTCLYSLIVSSF